MISITRIYGLENDILVTSQGITFEAPDRHQQGIQLLFKLSHAVKTPGISRAKGLVRTDSSKWKPSKFELPFFLKGSHWGSIKKLRLFE